MFITSASHIQEEKKSDCVLVVTSARICQAQNSEACCIEMGYIIIGLKKKSSKQYHLGAGTEVLAVKSA